MSESSEKLNLPFTPNLEALLLISVLVPLLSFAIDWASTEIFPYH